MTSCARGCTIARRHARDCSDAGDCLGCQPRDAEHGLLCHGCHKWLLDMLATAPGQVALLETAKAASLAHPFEDAGERRADDGAPTPYSLAVHDTIMALTDILNAWVDMLCEDYCMAGPADHDVASVAAWLTAQHRRLEACDGIADLWEELSEVMSQAHALAPWREEMTRVKGVPCPCCHRCSLVIFGGDEDVTCLRCHEVIPPGRYARWVHEHVERMQRAEVTA